MSLKVGDIVEVTNRTYNTYASKGPIVDIDNANKMAPFIVRIAGLDMYFHPDDIKLAHTDVVQYPTDGHPDHYTAGLPEGVAAVDVIKAHLAAGGTWDTANALKYLIRHPLKGNPTQDIKKAIRCLNMWVAEQEAA